VPAGHRNREAVSYEQVGNRERTEDHNHGIIEWIFEGTDVRVFKTNKPFSVRRVTILDLKNGRISRNRDYYDAATMMKQVGVLPTPKTESPK